MFRGAVGESGYRESQAIAKSAHAVDDATVEATIAYCEYLYGTYGRFPVYPAAFRTGVGFQAGHLDLHFYARHYRPAAPTHAAWHGSRAQ